jgi:lipopolysaccharide/colanic/teichoic acid biosynthesis glycosyltransferase
VDELASDRPYPTLVGRPAEVGADGAPARPVAPAEGWHGLSRGQALRKRAFDLLAASIGLVVLSPVILVAFVAATIDTRATGFFRQERIGLHGSRFKLVKIRSMRADPSISTSVTTARDPRITRLGGLWRRTKIDELPQLWNVIRGQMSLVGPRPEVPGFADRLTGRDALILTIRPGITGPATLHFRDEERLLAATDDPEAYNRDVLFPTKVRMNLEYLRDYSFRRDLGYLWRTVR